MRGVFCPPRHFFSFFCDSFAVDVGNHLFYDITVLPTTLGALCGVGVGGSGGLATFFSRFCASSCLTTCLRWKHPVSPFCFCPHSRFCPSNLVSPPSYTSFSGCRLQRAGQSRTAVFTHKNSPHMHFQTDEEEEEKEEAVKKRVCEPGRTV